MRSTRRAGSRQMGPDTVSRPVLSKDATLSQRGIILITCLLVLLGAAGCRFRPIG